MKVLFVCNNAFNPGNGLSVSVRRTMQELGKQGVETRLMAVRNIDPNGPQPYYPLEHFKFPVFEPIVRANGFCYARIDRIIIHEAVEWADVVHLQEALFLENAVRRIASDKGKPCTATFHLFPHNITANLGIGHFEAANRLAIRYWNSTVFNHCTDIQCPSAIVEKYLQESGIQARTHVISNGLDLEEQTAMPYHVYPDGIIDIVCIGRLSNEKSQNTLLEAMKYSRYAKRIRLNFAGTGPKARHYIRMAEKLVKRGILNHPPTFGFYDSYHLSELIRRCYLYVHCAWVEVEGLSCLEAISQGLVPVIGEGELVGTSAFALCPQSLYPQADSRALAERIDWWIEHPQIRNEYAARYAESVQKYDICQSITGLVKMFEMAMQSQLR